MLTLEELHESGYLKIRDYIEQEIDRLRDDLEKSTNGEVATAEIRGNIRGLRKVLKAVTEKPPIIRERATRQYC